MITTRCRRRSTPCQARSDDLQVADHEPIERRRRVTRWRQLQDHRVEHEHDDQERWDVADRLDVYRRDLRHQPIRREASDADQGPEDREKGDSDNDQQEGVLDPGQERFPNRRRGIEAAVGDGHSGGLREKVEAGRQVLCDQLVAEVVAEEQEAADHDDDGEDLERPADEVDVPPERWSSSRWRSALQSTVSLSVHLRLGGGRAGRPDPLSSYVLSTGRAGRRAGRRRSTGR